MSLYFKNKLEKLNNDFIKNLSKLDVLKDDMSMVETYMKENSIEQVSEQFLLDFKEVSASLFSDNVEEVYNIKIYNGKIDVNKIKELTGTLRYLRLLYIYSIGIKEPSKAKKLIKNNFKFLEKTTVIPEIGGKSNSGKEIVKTSGNEQFDINSILKNLPPNISSLVGDISKDVMNKISSGNGEFNIMDIMNMSGDVEKLVKQKISSGQFSEESIQKEMKDFGLEDIMKGKDLSNPIDILNSQEELKSVFNKLKK